MLSNSKICKLRFVAVELSKKTWMAKKALVLCVDTLRAPFEKPNATLGLQLVAVLHTPTLGFNEVSVS